MQDRPTRQELLQAVERFLRTDVLPGTDGRVRFHTLVAMNLLSIVKDELRLEQAHLAAEARGLASLLAQPAPDAGAGSALLDRVRIGNERLCERIREGGFAEPQSRAALVRHLRAMLEDKLAVANPRVLARMQAER
jgi:Domain of unknown function (DUF6285)